MTASAVVRLDLPSGAASVGEARRFVRHSLAEWSVDPDSEAGDAAVLLTSELATNCVLHARTPFAVVVERHENRIRVLVLDGSPVPPEQRTTGSITSTTGRGLALLTQLSAAWGPATAPMPPGYVKGVWFDVVVPDWT